MAKITIDLVSLMHGSPLLSTMPLQLRKQVETRILSLSPEKKKKAALIFLQEKKEIQTLERNRRKTILDSFSQAITTTKASFLKIIKKRVATAEKTEQKKALKKSLSKLRHV